MRQAYDELLKLLREHAILASTASLLNWDQETVMPPTAGPGRAEELALLGKLAHQRFTDPRIGELLDACEADPPEEDDGAATANLREMRREYERARKLPAELVAEMSRVSSQALEAWKGARANKRFEEFRPWLERQVELNRRKAECYGAPEGGELYDALLDEFEPGSTGADLEAIFEPLRRGLAPLIAEITATGLMPGRGLRGLTIPIEMQRDLNVRVMERIGFDFTGGRVDTSTHPFSSGIAPGDTRITTRYREEDFLDSLGSTLHELGHGLYEQGLPKKDHWGQPLGEALGLSIHESQSRLWENHVGRSRAFWEWALPEARDIFAGRLDSISLDDVVGKLNSVEPHLIRVESDEATYNLHVMLRFDLERAMLRGDLAAADLPTAWNERIQSDLGLVVPDDAQGCLQDIHWAMGTIAYFPNYTLGNLYAAQLWETIHAEIPDLEEQISRGEFETLLSWLREKIHVHGRRHTASELCLRLTGRPLSQEPLIRHLDVKLRELYSL